MKLPPYPRYKDSGIDWLGEIPEHWEVKRNLGLFKERNIKDNPELELLSVTQRQGVILQSEIEDRKNVAREDKSNYKRVEPNDLVYNKMRMWQGAIGESKYVGIVSPAYVILEPKEDVTSRYFYYQYKTPGFISEAGRLSYGLCDDMNSLRYEDFKTLYSLTPPVNEQVAIINFLDRETSKIDMLIAKEERLITLLQEKRQALISHAVTKSLMPNLPMKDSGIKWLGKIPAHWEIWRLKHLIEFITSGSRGWAEHYSDDGDIFIRIGNLTRESIEVDLSDIQYVSVPLGAEGERTRISAGDLLISITAYLGSVAVAPKDIEGAYVSQHVALVRPIKKLVTPRWLGYSILSAYCKAQFDLSAYGGTKIQLSLDDVKELTIVLPPLSEQCDIGSYIDREVSRIQLLIAKSGEAIKLLKEHRTALISAAITGKIDVRQYRNGNLSNH